VGQCGNSRCYLLRSQNSGITLVSILGNGRRAAQVTGSRRSFAWSSDRHSAMLGLRNQIYHLWITYLTELRIAHSRSLFYTNSDPGFGAGASERRATAMRKGPTN
jgi:hypothetical protein